MIFEESSLVMMNISFMKYELPKNLDAFTDGEKAY